MGLSSPVKKRRRDGASVPTLLCVLLLGSATLSCENVVSRPDDLINVDPGGPNGVPFDSDQPALPGEDLPLSPLARRLTHLEYQWTLEDLFQVTLTQEEQRRVPVDRPLEGFARVASGLTVLEDHVRAYSRNAVSIVARIDVSAVAERFAGCDLDELCRDAFVRSVGRQVYRRPLDTGESERLVALWDGVAAEGVGAAVSAAAVLQAMLQSPQFLYVMLDESTPGRRPLSGYELASRLSYYLWGSTPDEALLDAAANESLLTSAGLSVQVERLLSDEVRSGRGLGRFVVDWTRLASIPDDDGLRQALTDTTRSFYVSHVTSGAPFFSILEEPSLVLTGDLAERYGLVPQGAQAARYPAEELGGPRGLLAQPGVIAGMTNADGGEIVVRGLFLLKQLFCGDPPDPPEMLQELIEEFVRDLPENATEREIAEERLNRANCGNCHAVFDPMGYAFGRFDERGGRTHAEDTPVDGWIPAALAGGEQLNYQDFESFAGLLATQERVQECMVRHQMEFALGSRLEATADPDVIYLADQLARAEGTHRDLLVSIIRTAKFTEVQIP